MSNKERLKLIIENWFLKKTNIRPTDKGLNDMVDRIYYNKQLRIADVVGRSEQLVCDVCGSTDVIEAPHMGKNCNQCHPL